MYIILGFGSTEKEQRENIYKAIENIVYEAVKNNRGGELDTYNFTDEAVAEIKEKVEAINKELKDKDTEISTNHYKDAPERYTYFYHSIAHDFCNVFIGVDYRHINTRHPFSPDGIALMCVKEPYWFSIFDISDYLSSNEKEESENQ